MKAEAATGPSVRTGSRRSWLLASAGSLAGSAWPGVAMAQGTTPTEVIVS